MAKDIRADLMEYFKLDLTDRVAELYVDQLLRKIGTEESFENVLRKGSALHEGVARTVYAPVAASFVEWVLENHKGKGAIHFLARDAIPFYHVAQQLKETKPKMREKKLNLLYFTRGVAGQSDEIAGLKEEQKDDNKLKRYFAEQAVGEGSLLVDAGLYGSLYQYACKELWHDATPGVVFLYSKNPFILGFLNKQLEGRMNPEVTSICDLFANSIECLIPQEHYTPTSLVESAEGKLNPELKPVTSRLIRTWRQSALEGFVLGTADYVKSGKKTSVYEEMMKIGELAVKSSKGRYTGVLPENTPEWSKKEEFLANWSLGVTQNF